MAAAPLLCASTPPRGGDVTVSVTVTTRTVTVAVTVTVLATSEVAVVDCEGAVVGLGVKDIDGVTDMDDVSLG